MRTIKVTGKGQIKVHPDTTRIRITIEGLYKEYSDTLRHSAEDTEHLKDILVTQGFERSDLKTLSFDVDSKYESYKYRDTYRRRLVGYEYSHTMKVEFPSDNERLGRILYALSRCNLHPEFRFSYIVGNPEAAKNELLGKAVMDSREKASVLTAAAGVTLADIQSIDYSWGEIDLEFRPMERRYSGACDDEDLEDSYNPDIEPDDIEMSDSVTVTWEIQ